VPDIRAASIIEPRLFDASAPILYLWRIGAEDGDLAARVAEIALRLHRLGQGLDMAWATAELLEGGEAEAALLAHRGRISHPTGPGDVPCAGPGTFDSLVARHAAFLTRFAQEREGKKTVTAFRQPPKAV
jgi:CRISPR-associated protein Csb2